MYYFIFVIPCIFLRLMYHLTYVPCDKSYMSSVVYHRVCMLYWLTVICYASFVISSCLSLKTDINTYHKKAYELDHMSHKFSLIGRTLAKQMFKLMFLLLLAQVDTVLHTSHVTSIVWGMMSLVAAHISSLRSVLLRGWEPG